MRTAVVTGGGSGIGKAVGDMLIDEGWKVVDLGLENGFDVRNYALMARTFKHLESVNLLVNSAGIGSVKPFHEQTEQEWREVIDTNLIGTMNCCHAVLPYMQDGDIINISSRSGQYGHKGLAAYCASKAAVTMFSEAVAMDLQKKRIRVAYIMPGIVNTGFAGDPLREWHIAPENVAKAVLDIVGMPRRAAVGRYEIKPAFPEVT